MTANLKEQKEISNKPGTFLMKLSIKGKLDQEYQLPFPITTLKFKILLKLLINFDFKSSCSKADLH